MDIHLKNTTTAATRHLEVLSCLKGFVLKEMNVYFNKEDGVHDWTISFEGEAGVHLSIEPTYETKSTLVLKVGEGKRSCWDSSPPEAEYDFSSIEEAVPFIGDILKMHSVEQINAVLEQLLADDGADEE